MCPPLRLPSFVLPYQFHSNHTRQNAKKNFEPRPRLSSGHGYATRNMFALDTYLGRSALMPNFKEVANLKMVGVKQSEMTQCIAKLAACS